MKRLLLFGLVALWTLPAMGQNFQAIQDNGHRLFDSNHGLRAIRVDSTAFIEGDSVFYLSKTIQPIIDEWYCYTPYGPSWMGDYIRMSPDGTHLFFNLEGDTIRFRTQAGLGEVWPVYDYNDLYIQGEVLSIEEEIMFDGMTDMVKTVGLQVMNNEMNPIPHNLNDKTVQFSENYGIVGPLNFVAFPLEIEDYYQFGLTSYALAGIEGHPEGIQNLTWKEVFDFQPGDELHVRTREISFGEGNEVRTIFRFLDRLEQGDSIIYTRQVESDSYHVSLGEYTYAGFTSQTAAYVVTASPLFDQFSMTPVFTSSGNEVDYYIQYDEEIRIKGKHYLELTTLYLDEESGCFTPLIDAGCYNHAVANYVENLGGPYYHCELSSFYFTSRELVYYNIDGVEWGTPFSLLLSADVVDKSDFKVYPNPAQDRIFVDVPEGQLPSQIEIMDLQGRILKSENLANTRSEVQIENLPQGVFIYRVLSGNEIVKTGKIVVHR